MVLKMNPLADDDLLQQARQLSLPALEAVYDRFNQGLYYYALRQLGDPVLAEDCVAEVFKKFLQALKLGGGPNSNLKSYLYQAVHNWVTDQYRRDPNRALALDPTLTDPEAHPCEQAEQNILLQQTRAALHLLTPEQRQVITLRFVEGWELDEIAQTLEKPVGAVKSLQHRALAALQRILLPHEKADERRTRV